MSSIKLGADSGGGTVALKGPASTTDNANVELKLPIADGTANQVLATNGSGQLQWATDSTNTNASNLSSGTLPDARFPATLPAVSGANLTGVTDTLSFRNMFINGSMQVAQRSSSVSITGDGSSQDAYRTVDRWFHNSRNDSNWTYTKEDAGPAGFANSLKVACTGTDSSIAGNVYKYVGQRIEGQNLQQLQKGTATAKSFTVSFWVKSNLPGTYVVEARDYDTPRICCKTYTVPANENWNKFSVTFPGDTTGAMENNPNTSLEINFWLAVGADKSAGTLPATWEAKDEADRAVGQVSGMLTSGKYWQMTGAQMELGDTATEYEHRTVVDEEMRCQRYYWIAGHNIGGDYPLAPANTFWSGTRHSVGLLTPVPMRNTPTITEEGNGCVIYGQGSFSEPTSFDNVGISGSWVRFVAHSGDVGDDSHTVCLTNKTNGGIALSAEL